MPRHSASNGRIDLKKFGPRIEVAVGLPIVRNENRTLSRTEHNQKPIALAALIDTGSARTVVVPKFVQQLNLPFVSYTKLSFVGGIDDKVSEHVASIQFPRYQFTTVEIIPIISRDLPRQPVDCLIGRDIISRWLFTYDGRTGAWSIDEDDVDPWVEPPEGLLT